MLFEVEITKLVWGYILMPKSVTYCFRVTLTFGFNVQSISLYYLGQNSQIWCVGTSLVLQSVLYCFHVTATLTSGIWSRQIMSGAYLLYYLRWLSQICYVDTSWGCGVTFCFLFNVTLTSDLSSRKIVSGAYLLYYLT